VQFLVTAYAGTDPEAPARRQAVREAQLVGARRLTEEGRFLVGGAILNDAGEMIGSAVIADFPSRADLDAWLREDPYVTGGVWKTIEVKPFRAAVQAAPKE
jgi:hypothetical protein